MNFFLDHGLIEGCVVPCAIMWFKHRENGYWYYNGSCLRTHCTSGSELPRWSAHLSLWLKKTILLWRKGCSGALNCLLCFGKKRGVSVDLGLHYAEESMLQRVTYPPAPWITTQQSTTESPCSIFRERRSERGTCYLEEKWEWIWCPLTTSFLVFLWKPRFPPKRHFPEKELFHSA